MFWKIYIDSLGVVKMNDEYMKIALEESQNANCAKGKVGAVIVLKEKVKKKDLKY